MTYTSAVATSCSGKTCSWGKSRSGSDMGCQAGSGDCALALILEARPSEFHDQTLIEATLKIKQILEGIAADARGRKLSFVHTNMGTLLAWVEHGGAIPPDAVTAEDADATVAEALGLNGYTAVGAGQA